VTRDTVFAVLTRDRADMDSAKLLVRTLRTFGGSLAECDVLFVVSAMDDGVVDRNDLPDGIELIGMDIDPLVASYPFGPKVAACAIAELHAAERASSLVWMAPQCLIIRPPEALALDGPERAAFRAVHIRNIGPTAGAPLDAYWSSVYRLVGGVPPTRTVRSLVDQAELSPYYNSHLFAIDPRLKLLSDWYSLFRRAVSDERFQRTACRDELHRIFLHQAVLSALVATRVSCERLHELPPGYSYPLHFHAKVPPRHRAASLEECVVPVYEGAYVHPDTLGGLPPGPRMGSWLKEHAPSTGEA
jgi:hypothetical protein